MAKKKKRKAAKRRHECNGQLCFHGAFGTRSGAEAKAQKLGKKAFIVKKLARYFGGPLSVRYHVMTQDKSGVPF